MLHCGRIAVVLLLASLARGQALTDAVTSDIKLPAGPAMIGSAPAAPVAAADDHAPFGVDDERFAQFLREESDPAGSGSLGSGALSTILLGLALLFAAGPVGRLVSGLEKPPRPRRADESGAQD